MSLLVGASALVILFPDLFDISKFRLDESSEAGKSSAPADTGPRYDPQLASILEDIERTTPEGKWIIMRAHFARPEFKGRAAKRTLSRMIKDAKSVEGLTRIEPLGWEASQTKGGRWGLRFHYHRWPNLYQVAEWEYDDRSNRLFLLDREQGSDFWLRVAGEQ